MAVADGFHQVLALDFLASGQVGDGAREAEDALVGAGGEVETLHHLLQ